MKDKWGNASQVDDIREHPIHRYAVPFPNGEGKEEAASPSKKGSQPRLAALGSPFPWKGLAWTPPPSYGRRCPEGAEVGWGKQDERSEGKSFQLRRLRQYPNTAQRLLSGHCPKRGKEGSARRFAWPLISPKTLIKILIKILAMDPLLCYNTRSAGMARLF